MPPVARTPFAKPASPKSAAGSLASFCPWAAEPGVRVYLCPVGLMPIAAWAKGAAVPLAGGRFAFSTAELIVRQGDRIDRAFAPLSEILAWGWERARDVAEALDRQLGALTRARVPFGGVALDRPRLMGIVNVTPDSFSDGGDFIDPAAAIAHGEELLAAGADILDIGGESTRPGAAAVPPEQEEARILPVIRHFAERGAVVSVDTRHARVMASALAAGGRIVNDIAGLGDAGALPLVARFLGASFQSQFFYYSSGWIQLFALPLLTYIGVKLQRSSDAQSEVQHQAMVHIATVEDQNKQLIEQNTELTAQIHALVAALPRPKTLARKPAKEAGA